MCEIPLLVLSIKEYEVFANHSIKKMKQIAPPEAILLRFILVTEAGRPFRNAASSCPGIMECRWGDLFNSKLGDSANIKSSSNYSL